MKYFVAFGLAILLFIFLVSIIFNTIFKFLYWGKRLVVGVVCGLACFCLFLTPIVSLYDIKTELQKGGINIENGSAVTYASIASASAIMIVALASFCFL
jgi:hypothetical protein